MDGRSAIVQLQKRNVFNMAVTAAAPRLHEAVSMSY